MRKIGAATVVALAVAATSPVGLGRQAFYARTDLVHVPVIVTARDGRPVTALKAGDFELREDGQAQKIEFFAEGAVGDGLPLHLGMLLDTSESMQKDLPDAARASIQFVNALDEVVDATLVEFNPVIRVSRFAPASYLQMFDRIRNRESSGLTALYDAVGVYASEAGARPGQHVAVLFTDGGDSRSSITFGKVIESLRMAGNVVVYAIGYLENQSSTARFQQQMSLTQLARETGGDAYFPHSPKQMGAIYDRIRAELRARYTIGYISTNRAFDGRFRKLQVSSANPALKGASIRARSGYYAPGRRG